MNWFDEKFGEFAGLTKWLAFLSLLLPFSLLMLALASGLIRTEAYSEASDRWFVLQIGMITGGFGVWTGSLGTPILLSFLRFPSRAAHFFGALLGRTWPTSLLVLGLAGYSLWDLRASAGTQDLFRLALCAMFMLAGTGLSLWLEIRGAMKRFNFGTAGLEPDEIFCEPGGEAVCVLTTGKQAVSVTGRLDYYDGEGECRRGIEARVSAPEYTASGWRYRITATLPKDASASGGNWELAVLATGARGGNYEEAVAVTPKKA